MNKSIRVLVIIILSMFIVENIRDNHHTLTKTKCIGEYEHTSDWSIEQDGSMMMTVTRCNYEYEYKEHYLFGIKIYTND